MTQEFPLMVPGAVSTSEPKLVTAPYDDAPIATVASGDSNVVDTALATADRLYKDRHGWLPVYKRVEILEKTIEIMTSRADELAVEAAREGGKPLIDSIVEGNAANMPVRNRQGALRLFDVGRVEEEEARVAETHGSR